MKTIDNFYGDNRFLSNFFDCNFIYNGLKYTNSEAAFQAQKTFDNNARLRVSRMNPKDAKRACGRYGTIKLRPDWESVKYQEMFNVLYAKFSQNPQLKDKLLKTGDAMLIEGNTWHDNIWGACQCDRCRAGKQRNCLGRELMILRDLFNNKITEDEAKLKIKML